MVTHYRGINWNAVEDDLDKIVWDRLTTNFWLPEKVPVANDLPSWRVMPEGEREVIRKVFASLTLLDTLQGSVGMPALAEYAKSQHEEAVLSNIAFMEHVHAKSYSTIFSTLCSTEEINELFEWSATEPLLQEIAETFLWWYEYGGDLPPSKHVVSVLSESFLFYTGFYAPLRMAAEGKITNTADIIRLILRDEGVHGFYIGAKFQKLRVDFPELTDEGIKSFLRELYELETQRVDKIYETVDWADEVKVFLRYNANKALANLGIEPMFPAEETQIPAYIMAALDPGTGETHDFFSGSGASYVMGKTESTDDNDWSWD